MKMEVKYENYSLVERRTWSRECCGTSVHLQTARVHPSLHPAHLAQGALAAQEGSSPGSLPEALVDLGGHEVRGTPGETKPHLCNSKKYSSQV